MPRPPFDRPDRRPRDRRAPPRRGAPGPERPPERSRDDARVIADRYLPRGEAETTYQGSPLVIWQGIPGEKAVVRIEHRGANHIHGRFVDSPEPHPHRVDPSCDKVSSCGGCPFMHLNPAGQEAARRSLVQEALAEHGLTDVEVGAFHRSPSGLRDFRHVIKVAVGHSDEGRIRVGAWGRRNRHVIPIPDCSVSAPVLRKVMASFAHHVIDLQLHPFEPETGEGVLRVAVLRASRTTGEVLVTLVVGKAIRELRDLAERLAADEPAIAGVWLHINDGPGNAIFTRDGEGVVGVKPLGGRGEIEETMNGVRYRVGPGDFFQTNPAMAEVLYQRTLERLELVEGTPFLDLYSGVGGLALQAARTTGWSLGIEEVEGAVQRARDAALLNRLPAEFLAGRVEDVLPEAMRRIEGTRPVVAVNPARRGLEPGVVDAILALDPQRVAYISCNPRAMARDLALFRAGGLEPGPVELFDMFPNTAHVEALVVLEGRASRPGESVRRAPRRKIVRADGGSAAQ
jgi:23S rRNA (uracil1939-C5)-methyltransferase